MVKYTRELLEEAAKNSISVAGVLRKLGLKQAGGTHSHISKKLTKFKINTSHFLGQGYLRNGHSANKRNWKEILVKLKKGSLKEKSHVLRRALIES